MEEKNDMGKLLGYKEWIWDESEVVSDEDCDSCEEDYPCEYAYQGYADFQYGELLFELSQVLHDDKDWDYGFVMGYVGWMNSFGHSEVEEVNQYFLKKMVFDTINDQHIVAKLDFTHVDNGVIVLTRSHHDRPMGETLYIFQVEDWIESGIDDTTINMCEEKLYELGLKERPKEYKVVR